MGATAYPILLQRLPEPVDVMAATNEHSVEFRQATDQRADVAADLPSSGKQVELSPLAITDGMQFRVHAAFGATGQAATPLSWRPC